MTNQKNRHILIVEDSLDLQILLANLFQSEGYTLTQAYNGKQALDLLQSMPELPGVILLDIMMPVMDAFAFREQQCKDPKLLHIPIVVMTADNEPQSKAMKLGAEFFFKKPIRNINELIRITNNLVDKNS